MITSPDITDYDKFSYDYSTYWKNRQYEHLSEQYAINNMLSGEKGTWFLDIGGSYGRHLNLYQDNYENKIICDYSIGALKQAKKTIKDNSAKNVFLVAANAYNLPFKDSVFNGISMIRVIHHLEEPERAINETSRVIQKSGIFILEYANKINIKASIRALFRFKPFFIFSKKPYEIESKGSCEGANRKNEGIILNLHPQWIKTLLVSHEYRILKKISVSFLRIPFLKRLLGTKPLLLTEKIFQKLLGWSNLPPSIFLKLRKRSGNNQKVNNMEEILSCPKCKGSLQFENSKIRCRNCKSMYKFENGIYDLRYPLISR